MSDDSPTCVKLADCEAAAQDARNRVATDRQRALDAKAEAAQIIRDAKAAAPDGDWTAIVWAKVRGDDDDAAAAQDAAAGALPTTEAAKEEARIKKDMVNKILDLELFLANFGREKGGEKKSG